MRLSDAARATRLPPGALILIVCLLSSLASSDLHAQTVRGRVLERATGRPVHLAGVHLVDADRNQISMAIADSLGRYALDVPASGEYYLFAQRLGYFETVSPLLEVSAERPYEIDLELRPEPIRLDPIGVTVRNEEAFRWLRLELGINPVVLFGFRMYQGARLEEARLRAEDNTETLRFLFIPVSHGKQVCVGTIHRPVRGGYHRTVEASAAFEDFRPDGTGVPAGSSGGDGGSGEGLGQGSCGSLYLDGRRIPNEHIESIDMRKVAVVVTWPGTVRMYTYAFDWSFRPGR